MVTPTPGCGLHLSALLIFQYCSEMKTAVISMTFIAVVETHIKDVGQLDIVICMSKTGSALKCYAAMASVYVDIQYVKVRLIIFMYCNLYND